MKRGDIFLTFLVVIVISLASASNVVSAFTGSGAGTQEDPYQITNWSQLQEMNENRTAHYILNNNLNSSTSGYSDYASSTANSGQGWLPIGNSTSGFGFNGTFDGNKFKISDLFINRSSTVNIGLFGYTNSGSDIKNLGLENVNITGNDGTGGLVGENGGKISNSYVTGVVSGNGIQGPLGGLTSGNLNTGIISNSYSRANVSGSDTIGGLVGINSGNISNSYSTGFVDDSAAQIKGGLVADNLSGGTASNSFWDTQTSNQSESAGGTGKTTSQMKNRSTFLYSGWDFGSIWNIDDSQTINNGYPYLFSPLGSFNTGDGTQGNPYQVEQCFQLQNVKSNLTASYILVNNLDCSDTKNWGEEGWNPIGKSTSGNRFNGIFDGQNLTISGIFINSSATYVGLFGYADSGSDIKNIGLENFNITGQAIVGALVGQILGNVSNSYSTGFIAGTTNVGGIIGVAGGSLTNLYSSARVSNKSVDSGSTHGGLIGVLISGGNVSNSYSTGDVSGRFRVGGFIGTNEGNVSNSYSTGQASGEDQIGGFIGRNIKNISNSYSLGLVLGDTNVGGLAGLDVNGTVSNSFWDNQTSNQSESVGGTGKTTSQMKNILTFNDTSTEGLTEKWGIVLIQDYNNETWYIDNSNGYPKLGWEPFILVAIPTTETGNYSKSYIEANMTISGDFDLHTLTIFLYNETGIVNTSSNTSSPHFINFTGLPDGNYFLNATANDTSSNELSTSTRTITLDTTPPTIDFVSPTESNNSHNPQDYIQINTSAEEATTEIDKIVIRVFNSTNDLIQTNVSGSGAQFLFVNLTGLNEGIYYYNATVNDTVGNINNTETRTITLDTTPPIISSINAPLTEANISGESFILNVTITDEFAGVSTAQFNVSNESGQQKLIISTNSSGDFLTANLNTTTLIDGPYNLTVLANDSAGNLNDTQGEVVKFTIDNTPATINLSKVNSTETSIGVNFSCTDFGISGEKSCTLSSSAGTVSGSTISGLSCGQSYTITVTAESNSGKIVTSQQSMSTEDCTSSGGGGGGGGASTTEPSLLSKSHVWTQISPGTPGIMREFGSEFGIEEISVNVNSLAQNARITVTKHDSKPTEVAVEKSGKVYQYLQIETENLEDKISFTIVKFRVSKSWLTQNNVERNNIGMYKFNKATSNWDELGITNDSEDETYHYYSAGLTSFSFFAISDKESLEDSEVPSDESTVIDEETSPGIVTKIAEFWNNSDKGKIFFFAIVLMLFAGFTIVAIVLVKKRKELKEFQLSSQTPPINMSSLRKEIPSLEKIKQDNVQKKPFTAKKLPVVKIASEKETLLKEYEGKAREYNDELRRYSEARENLSNSKITDVREKTSNYKLLYDQYKKLLQIRKNLEELKIRIENIKE